MRHTAKASKDDFYLLTPFLYITKKRYMNERRKIIMSRLIKHGSGARGALERGIEKVAKAVEVTLGPKGRNVILDKSHIQGTCIITNDGVSIAREIQLEDEFENQGAQLLIEIANKTNDLVGDGTTTSIVIAKAMIREGIKNLEAGANPIVMRKGMKKALDAALEGISAQAVPIKGYQSILEIGTISSGDSKIGEMIAQIMSKLSFHGFITMEESQTRETSFQIIEGMRMRTGYLSRYMCTNKKEKSVTYHNPYIFITDKVIDSIKEILPLLEISATEKVPLLIMAKDITGEALTTIVLNNVKGNVQIVGVKAPGFGEMQKDILEDLAIMTGGNLFLSELGANLKETTSSMLGGAEKIMVDSENTIVLRGKGTEKAILKRIEKIKVKRDKMVSEFDKERMRERISKLEAGIAVIKIGADTEIELIEQKLRIEDAISATKAAVEEGIVIGGGCAYIHALWNVEKLIEGLKDDEKTGAIIVKNAMKAPLYQIAENGGIDGHVVVEKVLKMKPGKGFDAYSESYVDMIKEGIIDPVKVTNAALRNATSMVSTFLTTEAVNVIIKGTEAGIDTNA